MLEYTLWDRLADEGKEISEEEALEISQAAGVCTGPFGCMGKRIDVVLYAQDDEDEDGSTIEIVAVRYEDEWLCIPDAQGSHMSSELSRSPYE